MAFNENFSQMMAGYFYKRGSLLNFVKDKYPYDDAKLKYRSLKRYLDGERVPSFQDAKQLLLDMGIELSEQELLEVLELSNQEKESRYKKQAIVSGITIKFDDIFKDLDLETDEKILILKNRVEKMSCKTNKEYIIKLIEKDIKETEI